MHLVSYTVFESQRLELEAYIVQSRACSSESHDLYASILTMDGTDTGR